jgi:uncharacterized protein (TIGR03067 family)
MLLLAALLLVSPVVSGAGDKKGDLELAQGTWVVVSVEADGKLLPKEAGDEFVKKVELVVTGNKVAVKIPAELLKGKEAPTISFTIDPKTRPKSVDIKVRERGNEFNYKGIYSLEGDKLTLCIGVGGNPERPTDFTTKVGSNRMLGVFKRKAK